MLSEANALLAVLRRRRRRSAQQNARGLFLLLPVGVMVLLTLTPLASLAVSAVLVGLDYAQLSSELEANLQVLNAVDQRQLFQTTRVTDRNGVVLYEIFDEGRRTPVPLARVPNYLRDATIATEDATFYANPGFEPRSILRAVLENLTGQNTGGASTITQQLVRHIAFDYEERVSRSYTRKIKEIILARVLTQSHSKDQVLEMYLNEIYYGNMAYGVQAAARTIFLNADGKPADVSELGLAECALLAGLPQAPATFDPLSRDTQVYVKVKARQRQVLDLMVRHGYLAPLEADRAAAQPLRLNYHDSPQAARDSFRAPHFVVYARQEVEKLLVESGKMDPTMVSRGGLTIRTALDWRLQELAERVVRVQVEKLADRRVTNAALVAMRPGTGEVMAMVGSVDYWNDAIDGQVNVALSDRQPGSTIKPVLYAAALANGMSPATILWDVPITLSMGNGVVYTPGNMDGQFHGPVRLRSALANSYNIPTLKLLGQVGIGKMIETAHQMGIKGLNLGAEHYGLSISLGSAEVPLLEMTTAYATLANAGSYIAPTAILDITDAHGGILYQHPGPRSSRALDPRVAYLITHILADNEARIPAFGEYSLLRLSEPAAAKTGTTNDYHDAWTIGYTPYLVTGVWAGNSDNTAMLDSSGMTGAAPIWHNFMEDVFHSPQLLALFTLPDGTGVRDFLRPPGLETAPICDLSSLTGKDTRCSTTREEIFLKSDSSNQAGAGLQRLRVYDATAFGGVSGWCLAGTALPWTRRRPSEVLFIAPPEDPEEARAVYAWAAAHPVPVAPASQCQALITRWAPPTSTPRPAQPDYQIVWPTQGTTLRGTFPVVASVTFDPNEIDYYKVELASERNPSHWIAGRLHRSPVSSEVLDAFDAGSLPRGPAILRLVLVKKDSSSLPPYQIKVWLEN